MCWQMRAARERCSGLGETPAAVRALPRSGMLAGLDSGPQTPGPVRRNGSAWCRTLQDKPGGARARMRSRP
jgi:hypothetical protein